MPSFPTALLIATRRPAVLWLPNVTVHTTFGRLPAGWVGLGFVGGAGARVLVTSADLCIAEAPRSKRATEQDPWSRRLGLARLEEVSNPAHAERMDPRHNENVEADAPTRQCEAAGDNSYRSSVVRVLDGLAA